MKKKTLEDALFDTGAPDEIILLAMVEMEKQGLNNLNSIYYEEPFSLMFRWLDSEQGSLFWDNINNLYQIR